MSDEWQPPSIDARRLKARLRVGIAVFVLYALSIGPAHWIARRTDHRGFLIIYRPLVYAAEPLPGVYEALVDYVQLFTDRCTGP
jgi:hypothetical protein